MSDCETFRAQLAQYLDGELDRADARALEAHVDGCAACRAALDELDGLRRTLRDSRLRHSAPAALRERIAATPLPQPARRRVPAAPTWLRYAACAVIAFGAGALATHTRAPGAQAQLEHDAFASHWRALAAATPVDVVSSDRHTVKPWFAGKVAQAPVVRDFADQGFPLVGGRIDYLGGARVPVLVYRHGQHVIDVFVLPGGSAVSNGRSAQDAGYTLRFVTLAGQPAAVVADTDASELQKFVSLLDAVPSG